jgi:hypothetical protein
MDTAKGEMAGSRASRWLGRMRNARKEVVVLVIKSTNVSTAKSCDGWGSGQGHYSTGPDKTFPNRNRRLQIRDQSRPHPVGRKWRPTPGILYIENTLPSRTKLRNIRQGTTSNYPSIGRMATLYPRIDTHHDCLIRPQEPHLLQGSKKPKPMTSTMVLISFGIRCETGSHSRTQDGTVRRTIPTTRSMP